ncbi:prepilin-type N-terminal cleavage/methylation domain-containing protein [Sulfurimonas sp. SAG-AH-194-C20]|nr:prepilin-type N-terminal cleavage/methylation domain-containing protein [Sulfurimonas sp. SAG-AH-194-C20]MDF1878228.1 prepilin-type N-terminal cleavage/methylation domain-containing protein [Sulfurimonas sp. SAG-AH-194-C20]
MKRAGFTMIELIFVIVILGILAAVAIPKLAATRTDAEVSKAASDLATVVSDIGAYYTSQGTFADLVVMTNVADFDDTAVGAADAETANFQVGGEDCVLLTFNNVSDGNVTLSDVASPSTAACIGLQAVSNDLIKEQNFGGTGVTY